ncbi:MAG: hypothetical protein LUG85_08840 [Clostridiales bacterium]|nr:hypothetical protein [Clostridiales bacterium]
MTHKRNTKKIIICSIALCIILIVTASVTFVNVFFGRISNAEREMLDVFLPKYGAENYIKEINLTDGISCRTFTLSNSETEAIEADIRSNGHWHSYCENDKKILQVVPYNSEIQNILASTDLSSCRLSVFDKFENRYINTDDEYVTTNDNSLNWSYYIIIFSPAEKQYHFIVAYE